MATAAPANQRSTTIETAVSLLRSSQAHYVQVWASFLGSVCITVGGIIAMPDIKASDRHFALCALGFVTSQAFTLAKTTRDRAFADLPNAPAGAEFLRGTGAWYAQVVISFVLALVCASYGFLEMSVSPAGRAFLCMGAIFVLSSSFNLAKTLRDRLDAQSWHAHGEAQLPNVQRLARGTSANAAQVFIFFVASIVGTLGGLAYQSISISKKGFIAMGLFFMVFSAFNLAKGVRDMADPQKVPTALFMFQLCCALLLAVGATFGGLYSMPIQLEQKGFVALGLACTLSAAFNVAKLVRDNEELQKLQPRGLAQSLLPRP